MPIRDLLVVHLTIAAVWLGSMVCSLMVGTAS